MITEIDCEYVKDLAGEFDGMPKDGHFSKIQRWRRFSSYRKTKDGFERLKHEPFEKYAGKQRSYEPLRDIDDDPNFLRMMVEFSDHFGVRAGDIIEIHSIRTTARKGHPGMPTSQFHRDKVNGVGIFVVARGALAGGTTFLKKSRTGPNEYRGKIAEGRAIMFDDSEYVHYTSPTIGVGNRDVFVLAHKRITSSFNALYREHIRTVNRIETYSDKITGREFAESLGCRVPKLFHLGKVQKIAEPDCGAAVLKPRNGVESRGVLPLIRSGDLWRNHWDGEEMPFGRWLQIAQSRFPQYAHAQWVMEEMIIGSPLYDWKFHCIGGRAAICSQFRRNGKTRWAKVWSTEFEELGDVLPTRRRSTKRQDDESMPPPKFGAELVDMAETIASNLPNVFARIDLFEDDHGPVFGEITTRPANVKFIPWLDKKMGYMWIDALGKQTDG